MAYFNIEVNKVDNGYTVSFWEDEDDFAAKTQLVFEEDDGEHGEIECFKRLLWYIRDHYGMTGSKYDKNQIRITTGDDDEAV